MRRSALCVALLMSFASGAQAGDRSDIAQWSGFYAGAHIGYSNAKASADFSLLGLPLLSGGENLSGAVYGGQLGYNAQWNRFVLGIETDIMATSQKASSTRACVALACGVAVTQTSEDSIPWLGTLRLRAGLTLGRALIYGTGGIGYGAFKSTQTLTTTLASVTSTSQEQRPAWVVGGGIDMALTDRWSLRGEYLRIEASENTTTYNVGGLGLVTERSAMTENIGRFGVNYRF